MKYNDMKLAEAYQHVKALKSNIGPNDGFFRQMVQFEEEVCEL